MTCSRCCGLMIKDHYMDHEGTSGYTWMSAWRCMNCGHVHDTTIERPAAGLGVLLLVVQRGGGQPPVDDPHAVERVA